MIVMRLRFNSRGNGLGPGFLPLRLRVLATMAQVWVASATARLLHNKEWTVTGCTAESKNQPEESCLPGKREEGEHRLATKII